MSVQPLHHMTHLRGQHTPAEQSDLSLCILINTCHAGLLVSTDSYMNFQVRDGVGSLNTVVLLNSNDRLFTYTANTFRCMDCIHFVG